MFSKLKRVKTNFRGSLGIKRLKNILKILEGSSSWETFDPVSIIKKWALIQLGAQPRRKDHVTTSHVILLK